MKTESTKKVPNPRGRTPIAEGGKPNKRTIAALNIEITALREGLTPVDVMLRVMYENLDAANKIKVSDAELAEHLSPDDPDEISNLDEKRKLKHRQRNLSRKIKMRRDHLLEAANHASSAAPYIHPKLVSNKHSNDPDNPVGGSEGFNKLADAIDKLAGASVKQGTK